MATPALGCPALIVDELAAKLPAADRFEFGTAQLSPFLALWDEQSGTPLPAPPDGVALFASHGRPLLIAFRRADCPPGAAADAPLRALAGAAPAYRADRLTTVPA